MLCDVKNEFTERETDALCLYLVRAKVRKSRERKAKKRKREPQPEGSPKKREPLGELVNPVWLSVFSVFGRLFNA